MITFVVLLVVFLGAVLGQIPDSNVTLPLGPSPSVTTAFVFPDHPNRVITAGQVVEVLLGFVNNGEQEFNITHIGASLNHPQDFKYYIQNYTKAEFGLLVQPKEQVSVSYRFRPDPLIEPRDFGLVVSVYYQDESGANFTTAFFNGTISIVEPDNDFDLQQLFLYIGFFGVLGLAGYFAALRFGIDLLNTKKDKRSLRVPKIGKDGTTVAADAPAPQLKLDDDWLAGTNIRYGPPATKRKIKSSQ